PTVHFATFNHNLLNQSGFLGRMMVHVRYPDLNILDAIYINAQGGGPYTSYEMATNVNILLASADPVAVDYYASKYVLFPVSGNPWHNPDASTIFRQYLQSTADTLISYGFLAAMGDSALNVYVVNPFGSPILKYLDFRVDDPAGNNNGELNQGETANLIVTLENQYFGGRASGVVGTLLSDDEEIALIDNVSDFSDIPIKGIGDNSADPFVVSASADCSPHWAEMSLIVEADGGYVDTIALAISAGDPVILLVDDDGGEDLESYYQDALRRSGHIYSFLDRKAKAPHPFTGYQTIIWFTGACGESTLTSEDQTFLVSFLDSGGRLFLSGQNIGSDLVNEGHGPDFYANYLHANYISDSAEETFLYGVEGDPISGEFTFLAIDESQTSPSVIAPREGASPVLVYQISRDTAAIKYEGDQKVVYFALGFEGIRTMGGDDDELRAALMDNIIQWFRYVPIEGDVNQDGEINVLDVLMAVNIILAIIEPTPSQSWAADCNGDDIVNVLDVVGIVNVVLGIGTCPPTSEIKPHRN
ncbi:MAG: dockerin type I domain-containing protein, partial [bacterium]